MKKQLNFRKIIQHFFFYCLLTNAPLLFAQNYSKTWFMNDYSIDFSDLSTVNPTPVPLPNSNAYPGHTLAVMNGAYDINNDLLFYVKNNAIVDANGSLIYAIPSTWSDNSYTYLYHGLGPEMIITQVPEECDKYYIIYNWVGFPTINPSPSPIYTFLFYTKIDMSNGLGVVVPNESFVKLSPPPVDLAVHRLPGIALSKLNNNTRNLYLTFHQFTGINYLEKYVVSKTGITHDNTWTLPVASTHFPTIELDISPDQSMLAYSHARYAVGSSGEPDLNIIHLLSNGDVNTSLGNNGVTSIAIDPSKVYTGVEFSPDNSKLFVGITNPNLGPSEGIKWINLSNLSVSSTVISGSDFYGNSQIETAYDASGQYKLYVAKSTTEMGYIDPFPLTPTFTGGAIQSSTPFVNEVTHGPYTINISNTNFFNLPDQQDNENYDERFLNELCCLEFSSYDQTNFTASVSAVWDEFQNPINNGAGATVTIRDELRIPAGMDVTIRDMTFRFAPETPGQPGSGARIIVEQGARLILERTTFTADNRCDVNGLWAGIEVWGDRFQNQYPSGNPASQGIIHLDNSVIEHAWNGITTSHGGDYNTTGGVIIAENSSFKNNKRSVEFLSYQNTLNGNPVANLSRFFNTSFDIDTDFKGNNFNAHVTMWDVNGITFRGCNFQNDMNNNAFGTGDNRGIFSIDAGYNIYSYCNQNPQPNPCPSGSIERSSFKGFNHGIWAQGTGSISTVNIDLAEFTENVHDVYMEGVDNFKTTRSNFLIGKTNIINVPHHNAVYSERSTGYMIEDNFVDAADSPHGLMYGFWIRQSGHNNNRVYKNKSVNIDLGEIATGLNRNPNDAKMGLQILCNKHINLRNDIIINIDYDFPNINDHGVRQYQGDPALSAGNEFSLIGQQESDIYNHSPWTINYYHSGGITKPNNYTSSQVNVQPITTENSCPSRFGGDDKERLSAEERDELSDDYDAHELSYLNLLYNYNQLMDGGDKNALLLEIQLSWPEDAWDLRDELMSHSPYLSQDVLREAAMKDILPHAMLLEICLANPDATKSEEFLEFLQYEIPTPMPMYMIDLIRANWETETARTLLEGGIAYFTGEMADISNLLINDFKTDQELNYNQIRSWLAKGISLTDKYTLAESYFATGDYNTAENILNNIPNEFELKDYEGIEHDNYMYYFNLRRTVKDSGRTIGQLSSTEVDMLHYIIQNHTGRSKLFAQNILCFFYNSCAETPLLTMEGNESRIMNTGSSFNEIMTKRLITVSPNPAATYAIINWSMQGIEGATELEIYDVNGKQIAFHNFNLSYGHWIWDTRKIENGIYVYKVKQQGKILETGKIIVNN